MCTGAVAVAAAASTCELPSQVKTIMYAASEASLSFNDEGHWKWETMLKVLPLCVQMDFTRTFQTTTKCNNINHVWSTIDARPWANIFDIDINIQKKAKYTP